MKKNIIQRNFLSWGWLNRLEILQNSTFVLTFSRIKEASSTSQEGNAGFLLKSCSSLKQNTHCIMISRGKTAANRNTPLLPQYSMRKVLYQQLRMEPRALDAEQMETWNQAIFCLVVCQKSYRGYSSVMEGIKLTSIFLSSIPRSSSSTK